MSINRHRPHDPECKIVVVGRAIYVSLREYYDEERYEIRFPNRKAAVEAMGRSKRLYDSALSDWEELQAYRRNHVAAYLAARKQRQSEATQVLLI